ncbi:hypothetical protein BC835DRAFT_1410143 [Cytidiella melzeri]|nr:hypothetical protein BC835DRAFT_1410143 [Cytidiella melzeri]
MPTVAPLFHIVIASAQVGYTFTVLLLALLLKSSNRLSYCHLNPFISPYLDHVMRSSSASLVLIAAVVTSALHTMTVSASPAVRLRLPKFSFKKAKLKTLEEVYPNIAQLIQDKHQWAQLENKICEDIIGGKTKPDGNEPPAEWEYWQQIINPVLHLNI